MKSLNVKKLYSKKEKKKKTSFGDKQKKVFFQFALCNFNILKFLTV